MLGRVTDTRAESDARTEPSHSVDSWPELVLSTVWSCLSWQETLQLLHHVELPQKYIEMSCSSNEFLRDIVDDVLV